VRSAFLLTLLLDFADFDFRSSLAERRRGLFASVSASKARIPQFAVHLPTHPYLDLEAFLDLEAILDEVRRRTRESSEDGDRRKEVLALSVSLLNIESKIYEKLRDRGPAHRHAVLPPLFAIEV